MVVDRDGQHTLGLVLTDDILVQTLLDLCGVLMLMARSSAGWIRARLALPRLGRELLLPG